MRRQKRACGAGLQGLIGNWGGRSRAARKRVKDGRWRPAGTDTCLARRSKTRMSVENRVQRAVFISLRVAVRRGGRYT